MTYPTPVHNPAQAAAHVVKQVISALHALAVQEQQRRAWEQDPTGISGRWAKAADGRDTVTLVDRRGDPVQVVGIADFAAWKAGKTYVAEVARGVGNTSGDALSALFAQVNAVDDNGQPNHLLVTGRPGPNRAYFSLVPTIEEDVPTLGWRRWTPPVDVNDLTPPAYAVR